MLKFLLRVSLMRMVISEINRICLLSYRLFLACSDVSSDSWWLSLNLFATYLTRFKLYCTDVSSKLVPVDYTKKTKVQDDTKNPEWNEELIFPRANSDSVKVQVKIFHQESLGKDK